MSCYGGMTHYYISQDTRGFPFTYYKDNHMSGNNCYRISYPSGTDGLRGASNSSSDVIFVTWAFIANTIIALIVLALQGWLIQTSRVVSSSGRKTKARRTTNG